MKRRGKLPSKCYKNPVFWVIVVSVIIFLAAAACFLRILSVKDDGENSDLKEQQGDTLNTDKEHSYISEITKAATCTSEGIITYTCENCGDSYNEIIEATNHDYISAIESEGSCSAKSVVVYTCSVCGDTYTEEGELNPSIHSALISETSVYPTCTESGIKTTYCSGCGYTAKNTIPATGHSMDEVSCTATCTAGGVREYRCRNCGITDSEAIAAFGHNFSSATCTSPEICTRCGLSQGKRLGHTVHGGTCSSCGKYIPPKNVVKITGTDTKIYLPVDDNEVKDGYIIIKNCNVDYSDPKGAIISFVVDATNAKMSDTANRSMYIAQIVDDMTGEVIENYSLFIYTVDEPITTDSFQLYSLTYYGDSIPKGDYIVSFVEYDSVF